MRGRCDGAFHDITAALSAGGGNSYSFTDNYEYVRSYIEDADLALCNVETTFRGRTPHGYPTFNAPDELAYALADVGFDVGITSNNHMMDTGFDGMQRTLEVLRNQGMTTVGSRYAGEDTWSLIEKNGLKIGLWLILTNLRDGLRRRFYQRKLCFQRGGGADQFF